MRQASYRVLKPARDEAPFGDDVAWWRLMTVRVRTGAVLLIHPLQHESSEQIVDALVQRLSLVLESWVQRRRDCVLSLNPTPWPKNPL